MMDSSPESHVLINGKVETSRRDVPSAATEQIMELFDEVRVPLLRYLSHFPLALHDSEDVIQEAFLSLFQQFERGRSVQNLRGWVFRAVHHLALKKRLRSRRGVESSGSFVAAEKCVIDPALNPEERLTFHRMQECVQGVVRALPEQHRFCLYLRAEGLRYREIAEILNISLGAVSNALQRSLALIARATQR